MSLYFEDQALGYRFGTAARTIGEYEIASFAGLTGDYNPMHTDREFAGATAFGGIIAHGALGFSIAVGLINRTGMMDGTAVAFLGIGDWRFTGPIMSGDTVHATGEVTAARPSSKPGTGIVTHTIALVNQRGETVQTGTLSFLLRCRDAASDVG